MKRLTITLNDEMSIKVEKMANDIGISQASVVNIAIKEYFDQKDLISNMPDLLKLASEITRLEGEKESKK